MKNKWLSIVLSLLFPGLGHLYLGEVKKGILLVVTDIISILLISVFVGILLLPIIYIYAIVDSYKVTEVINQELYASRM